MPTYRNDSGRLLYAEDITGSTVAVADGRTVKTYKRLADIHLGAGWTLTSEQPYFHIAIGQKTITAAEAGWKERSIDIAAGVIDICATTDITVHANVQASVGYYLRANDHVQIRNNQHIATLHIYFTSDGTAIINELKE